MNPQEDYTTTPLLNPQVNCENTFHPSDLENFTSVTDADMTFAAGEYEVRMKDNANHNASLIAEVTITEGSKVL